jgi:hypothetical protein
MYSEQLYIRSKIEVFILFAYENITSVIII